MRLTNISLTGSSPTLTVLQQRNGSMDQLFAPIPGELLHLPVAVNSTVVVKVNGVPASCAAADGSTNCTFSYSESAASLPAMVSVSPSAVTFTAAGDVANLTIAGSGFGSSAAAVAVAIGRAACRVLELTDSSVLCQLAAGEARAGSRQVGLVVQGAGQATGSLSVNITMAIPSGGGSGGGGNATLLSDSGITLVNISGNGFETDPCDSNRVYIAGVRCGIAACSSTTITAVFPGAASSGPAAVQVVVADDAGADLDAASYSVANSSLEISSSALAVLSVTAAPLPLPACGGSVSFTLGPGMGCSSVTAAYLLPAFDLNVTSGGPPAASVTAALRAKLPLANLTSGDGQTCTGDSPVLRPGSYLLLVEGAEGAQVLSSQTLAVGLSISSLSPNKGTIGGGTLVTVQVRCGASCTESHCWAAQLQCLFLCPGESFSHSATLLATAVYRRATALLPTATPPTPPCPT